MKWLISAVLLIGLAGCATVPAGTSSANQALANERATIANFCQTAGNLGAPLKTLKLAGILTPADWVKIQDSYVTLEPICHPANGQPPSLTNYPQLILTMSQQISELSAFAQQTGQIAPAGGK